MLQTVLRRLARDGLMPRSELAAPGSARTARMRARLMATALIRAWSLP